jgi:predicted nucleotide-binding protein
MTNNVSKIKLTETQKLWLGAVCSKLRNAESVSARALKVELRDKLPRDFNPSDIDPRLLRHEDQITLLGIGLLDPDSVTVKNADIVILSIRELLLSDHEVNSVDAAYVSKETKLPEVDVAIIFKQLAEIGIFHDSGTNYGHGVDGWLTINIDERVFDRYLKFESIGQILETIIDDNSGSAKSADIIKEDFIQRLEGWRQELIDDVIDFYRRGSKERGDLAFARWKERFTAFLKTHNPQEAARFQALTYHIGYVIKLGEHSYDRFMREDGNNCLAFIDDLIDSVLKDRVTFLQVKFRTEVGDNTSVKENVKTDTILDYERDNVVEDPRIIFVVYGRNLEVRNSLFRFLRVIGLRPLEWSQAIRETGKASPFIGEILDVAFSKAQAVVVLMTPDDVAQLRGPFRSPGDAPYESQLTGQARPNVLFEAGMAMGRNPDRTIIVEMGTLRPFSDIAGRHTVKLSDDSAARHELAQRLETAGCPVDLTGRDWHTEGNFDLKTLNPTTSEASQNLIGQPDEHDRQLFTQFLSALPSQSKAIRFLRDHDSGVSFPSEWLVPLYDFISQWASAEHEFNSSELEKKRLEFWNSVNTFLRELGNHTSSTGREGWLSIGMEDMEDRPAILEAHEKLNNLGTEAYNAHQDLVREGKRLGISVRTE